MLWFDSHCHFDFDAFSGQQAQIWAQCRQEGVTRLLIPGVSPSQWAGAAELASRHPGMVWAAGLHPWWVADESQSPDGVAGSLRRQLTRPGCVAVGECGLDGSISIPIERQLAYLEPQLQVAREANKPVILHAHKAHQHLQPLLKKMALSAGGVIHGFSGSLELALSYWQLGYALGIGGTITYSRATKTRAAVAALPIEALVLETDAPDMPLQGFQGRPNSPLQLTRVGECLAQLRGASVADIASQTTDNCRRLFGL